MAEIPTYTFDELQRLHLPGYTTRGHILDILSDDSDWVPILSASIFRINPENAQLQTLTGIRQDKTKEDELATTHHGVVSTPTMQMPYATRHVRGLVEFRNLRGYCTMLNSNTLPLTAPITGEFGTVISYAPNPEPLDAIRGGTLSHFVGNLLEYKLGLPDIIEANAIRLDLGRVSLASVHIGFSAVGDEHDRFEPLVEFATAVLLTDDAIKLLPSENDRYSHLGWTDAAQFDQHVANKDVFGLAPSVGNAAVWFCAYGMCLKATGAVTSRKDLPEHLAFDDPRMTHRIAISNS
jgi:hypothetical protein